ncbi:MAG: hypothetical protein Q9220_007219 [cf. Caloplaca sp. 1 TL-2023]
MTGKRQRGSESSQENSPEADDRLITATNLSTLLPQHSHSQSVFAESNSQGEKEEDVATTSPSRTNHQRGVQGETSTSGLEIEVPRASAPGPFRLSPHLEQHATGDDFVILNHSPPETSAFSLGDIVDAPSPTSDSSNKSGTELSYLTLARLHREQQIPTLEQHPRLLDEFWGPRGQHPRHLHVNDEDTNSSDSHTDTDETASDASTMTSPNLAERILDGRRMYIDRGAPFPSELQPLVTSIKEARPAPITPNSKMIAKVNFKTQKMSEMDALHTLVDKLIYRPELVAGDDGEKSVAWTFDHLWLDRVPPPEGGHDGEAKTLREAMEAIGCPPKPKPDVTYGYADDALSQKFLQNVSAWYSEVLVLENQPWFPYLVVEWKGQDGTMREARLQARRDAAAEISCMHKFFKTAGHQNPSVNLTCVFSLCVDANTAEYRLHWRDVTNSREIQYHAERIQSALLCEEESVFRLRGMIIKTLDWVRGERLTAVQESLGNISKPSPQELAQKEAAKKQAAAAAKKEAAEKKLASAQLAQLQSDTAQQEDGNDVDMPGSSKKRKGGSK